mmetsp:Transcript_5954/g.11491  ORF Transcript_5954/g.11491 Transcript_5954/m.11491 type:complete len:302 (-) Transcript_5954:72-977(-)
MQCTRTWRQRSLQDEIGLDLAGHERVVLRLRLLNHLLSVVCVHALLVESESVLTLRDPSPPLLLVEGAVGLVVPEPLADFVDLTRKLLLDVGDGVHLVGLRVRRAHANHLPVELSFVDHRQSPDRLHSGNGSAGEGGRSDLDNVHRIVIAEGLQLRVLCLRVLPGLRNHAVVPEDVERIVPELPLLHVLLDGVALLLRRHLHLRARVLGDFNHRVHDALVFVRPRVNPVPGGDGLSVLEKKHPVLLGGEFALLLGRIRHHAHPCGAEGGKGAAGEGGRDVGGAGHDRSGLAQAEGGGSDEA